MCSLNRKSLAKFYDQCVEQEIAQSKNTAEFIDRMDEFFEKTGIIEKI